MKSFYLSIPCVILLCMIWYSYDLNKESDRSIEYYYRSPIIMKDDPQNTTGTNYVKQLFSTLGSLDYERSAQVIIRERLIVNVINYESKERTLIIEVKEIPWFVFNIDGKEIRMTREQLIHILPQADKQEPIGIITVPHKDYPVYTPPMGRTLELKPTIEQFQ